MNVSEFRGSHLRKRGMKWETNMFRALEPTMKAEARTRRALEKCIFERLVALILVFELD